MQRKFSILVIDPPWANSKSRRRVRPNQGKIDYPVMETKDIFMLLDKKIFVQTAIIHCVFMWVVERSLLDCEKNMHDRGYKRHCRFIWNKTNGVAPGFTVRFSHEFLIWYYKPSLLPVEVSQRGKYMTVFTEKPREHSRKPDYAYNMIDKLYPSHDRIDVFSREKRYGWEQFGNQVNYFKHKN